MTERKSRKDRRFLCPEFNRIKHQQLYETDRLSGRRPAVATATVVTITQTHTESQCITVLTPRDNGNISQKTEKFVYVWKPVSATK